MESILLRGHILHLDGWTEGSVLLEGGKILDRSDSSGFDLTADIEYEGLILPGLLNMHTHLGDHGARGMLPASLEQVVLPGGIKHSYLSSASTMDKVSSIRASLKEMHPGVTFILDYREEGGLGLDLLSEALSSGGPMVCPLARVGPGDDPDELIQKSFGIGQPSLSEGLIELRNLTRARKKMFSMHASELFREDIDSILELSPDHVVHMISGTEDDWKALSDRRIPVTLCPRSNLAYGLDPPLGDMLNSGLKVSLGTDNALSTIQDMFREMETAWLLLRRSGYEGSEASRCVFDMATGRMMQGSMFWELLPEWTRWGETGWPKVGDPGHLFLMKGPGGCLWEKDPFSQLVRFSGRSQIVHTPDIPH
ncbi:MAG: amidohydrolase family protein [Candidatus Thermoplasmatota archaeon]|nr:amidohydrolase family protein [Candidatus Thermoplasmatota archaeon]